MPPGDPQDSYHTLYKGAMRRRTETVVSQARTPEWSRERNASGESLGRSILQWEGDRYEEIHENQSPNHSAEEATACGRERTSHARMPTRFGYNQNEINLIL